MIFRLSLFTLLIFGLFQCKPTEVTSNKDLGNVLKLSKTQQVSYLTIEDGKTAIVADKEEAFFERIGILDMEIQMKKTHEGTREEALIPYKEHLKKSVLEFTAEDKVFLTKVFEQAYKLCNGISKDIYPTDIRLIKTDMNHYGGGVYYTREDCIIIPKDMLERGDMESFLSTMLHEIYHIYSRYNPAKRKAMYARIGYKAIEKAELPPALERRVLLNPDGIDYFMGIELEDKATAEKFTAIPIIYSGKENFTPSVQQFFAYLRFEMFKIKDGKVEANANGSSTIDMKATKGFYEQIGNNTQYIIHPDEVLADNFIIMCLAKEDKSTLDKLDEEGKKLVSDLEEIVIE